MKILNRMVDICLYTAISVAILTLVLLLIIKLFPELSSLEWFFGNVMPYIFLCGFALLMVGRTIYRKIPREVREE